MLIQHIRSKHVQRAGCFFFFFFFFLLFYLALNIKIRNFLNLNVEKLDKMGRGKELYSKFWDLVAKRMLWSSRSWWIPSWNKIFQSFQISLYSNFDRITVQNSTKLWKGMWRYLCKGKTSIFKTIKREKRFSVSRRSFHKNCSTSFETLLCPK